VVTTRAPVTAPLGRVSPEVTPPTERAAGRAEQCEHGSDEEQYDTDEREGLNIGDEAQDEEYEAQDDH
jgi:hypothetical protein